MPVLTDSLEISVNIVSILIDKYTYYLFSYLSCLGCAESTANCEHGKNIGSNYRWLFYGLQRRLFDEVVKNINYVYFFFSFKKILDKTLDTLTTEIEKQWFSNYVGIIAFGSDYGKANSDLIVAKTRTDFENGVLVIYELKKPIN